MAASQAGEGSAAGTRRHSFFPFWPPFVGAFGGLLGGLVSDWLLRRTGNPRLARQGMTFATLLVCTGVAGAAYFVADPNLAVLLISIGTFCGMASGVSAYTIAIAYGGRHVATVFDRLHALARKEEPVHA